MYYFWPEDEEEEEEEEWLGQNSMHTWRRLLSGSRNSASTLWVYMWLSLEGFMNYIHETHPKRVKGAEQYEVLSHELKEAVSAKDTAKVNRLLLQVRDVAAHSYFGKYQKSIGNLSTMWYLMCRVHQTKQSEQEYEHSYNRLYQVDAGAGIVGGANMHSSQEFHQERCGRIVDNFIGGETEYREQLKRFFPCSYDELLEWFQRGFNDYGWTFGETGVADMSDLLMDVSYGQHLRVKISAALEKGSDADVGQIIAVAQDVIGMAENAQPHFRSYAASTLLVLQVLYGESNEAFLKGNERVPKLKLLLVENLCGLKRMV